MWNKTKYPTKEMFGNRVCNPRSKPNSELKPSDF